MTSAPKVWLGSVQGSISTPSRGPSLPLILQRVEAVQRARRADPGDVLGPDVPEARRGRELADPGHVRGGQLLDLGIRAQRADLAGHVDDRLVERVAERVAGVAADEHGPGLGHEPAHVPDVAGHRYRAALERYPGPGGRVALDDDQTAAGRA